MHGIFWTADADHKVVKDASVGDTGANLAAILRTAALRRLPIPATTYHVRSRIELSRGRQVAGVAYELAYATPIATSSRQTAQCQYLPETLAARYGSLPSTRTAG
eukprot:928077-Pleurochrysis_carterae.AAC.3